MALYRKNLPQLDGKLTMTDGGIETTLIFHEQLELPHFAAFDLLKNEAGHTALNKYFSTYAKLAVDHDVCFVMESATWRANADWAKQLGYSTEALAEANQQAIELLVDLRNKFETEASPMVISGCIGPRGDGYVADQAMSAEASRQYHFKQINTFSNTQADMVTAITMNYVEEALGVALAAKAADIPSVISFTVETDGHLPTGQPLKDAIEQVDSATDQAPAYYMINCAHPTHFEHQLKQGEAWMDRIRGIRANASSKSHAELDEATELDAGNPEEFGQQHHDLKKKLQYLNVIGGCCGTDHRHVDEVLKACKPLF